MGDHPVAVAEGLSGLHVEPTPTGLVFNVMRFSLHDGPGIRTTVFLKGCPLRCWWCHNPESQSTAPEVVYFEDRCIRSGDCTRACPHGALRWEQHLVLDPDLCHHCGDCATACPVGARQIFGRWMTVPEVLTEVVKDQVFFDESGGGITVSGGEPLMQAAFADALLAECHQQRIRTVLETCGFGAPELVRRIARNVDLFLYDLKLMDPERHRRFTGVKNDLILQNLRMLAEEGHPVIVRIPLIPGVNDDTANLDAVSEFLAPLRLLRVDLLPYHAIAGEKYRRLHLPNQMVGITPPTSAQVEAVALHLRGGGFNVQIGG